MIPVFTQIDKQGRTQVDIYSSSFESYREIWLVGEIDDEKATEIIIQLRHLDRTPGEIKLFINSPGGSVTAGLSVIDSIRCCKNDVSTICTGLAASMGAFLLSSGTKGKRFALPNSEIMIHQPSGGAQGQATDIELVAKYIAKTKDKLNHMLAQNTGQPLERIARDCERDYYMSADEAVKYGIIDSVLA